MPASHIESVLDACLTFHRDVQSLTNDYEWVALRNMSNYYRLKVETPTRLVTSDYTTEYPVFDFHSNMVTLAETHSEYVHILKEITGYYKHWGFLYGSRGSEPESRTIDVDGWPDDTRKELIEHINTVIETHPQATPQDVATGLNLAHTYFETLSERASKDSDKLLMLLRDSLTSLQNYIDLLNEKHETLDWDLILGNLEHVHRAMIEEQCRYKGYRQAKRELESS